MSRATSALRKATQQNVKATSSKPAFKPQQLLSFRYEPNPGPINCTTLLPTKDFATDNAHPFHIRVNRKLEAFDPNKLHWRAQCPVDVSNKGFIRNWAAKRVRNAFLRSLKDGGLHRDGSLVGRQHDTEVGSPGKRRLSGALLMILQKDDITLTASKEEVQRAAQWVLHSVLKQQKEALARQNQQRHSERTHLKPPQNGQQIQFDRRSSSPSGNTDATWRRRPAQQSHPRAVDDPIRADRQQTSSSSDAEAIRRQVEYYFSDTNLANDPFLFSLNGGCLNQPVNLRKICEFKRMRQWAKSYATVKEAVRASRVLDLVDIDGTDGVKRKTPFDARLATSMEKRDGASARPREGQDIPEWLK